MKATAWQLFPIYGLAISDDDGLHAPLWGDATLVSRESMETLVRQHGAESHPLITHGKLSEALGATEIAKFGNAESLVEIPPHSYIAVRKRRDFSKTFRRAERIRALLSATMVLRTPRLTAFCREPRQFAWYILPRDIALEHGKPVSASIIPMVNPHIVQRPLAATKQSLRDSVEHGHAIQIGKSGQ